MNTEEKIDIKISAHDLTLLCCELTSLRVSVENLQKENDAMKKLIAKLEGEEK